MYQVPVTMLVPISLSNCPPMLTAAPTKPAVKAAPTNPKPAPAVATAKPTQATTATTTRSAFKIHFNHFGNSPSSSDVLTGLFRQ